MINDECSLYKNGVLIGHNWVVFVFVLFSISCSVEFNLRYLKNLTLFLIEDIVEEVPKCHFDENELLMVLKSL